MLCARRSISQASVHRIGASQKAGMQNRTLRVCESISSHFLRGSRYGHTPDPSHPTDIQEPWRRGARCLLLHDISSENALPTRFGPFLAYRDFCCGKSVIDYCCQRWLGQLHYFIHCLVVPPRTTIECPSKRSFPQNCVSLGIQGLDCVLNLGSFITLRKCFS
jgi:hypothetical protein